MANNQRELSIRETSRRYNIGDSTIRDWMEAGVFGNESETGVRRGKEVIVFTSEQLERLETFLLLRKWFGGELQVIDVVTILEDLENPENVESATETLRDLEKELENALEWVREKMENLQASDD